MSFGTSYESSIICEGSLYSYESYLPKEEKKDSTSAIKIFDPASQTGKETPADKQTKAPVEDRNFDVDELVKKYKKNPSEILNVLKINFTDKQKEELSTIINDKKKLESFLKLAQNDKLSADDIFAAVKDLKEFKPSKWINRVGSALESLFKGEISDFKEKFKSETVYYAKKLGDNISEINEERQDFSSDGKVAIAKVMTIESRVKENLMHFVGKSTTDNIKLYTEENVIQVAGYFSEKVEKADEFTENAIRLESLDKFKGTTIVKGAERITDTPEIKETSFRVASKSDMTDEYFDKITENMQLNPYICSAVDATVTAKDQHGKDRFSAKQVCGTSTELVPKNETYCKTYAENITELSKNHSLSSSNVLNIAKDITAHPEIRDAVMEKINSGNYTGSEIEQFSSQCAKEAAQGSTIAAQSVTTEDTSDSQKSETATNPIASKSPKNPAESVIADNTYKDSDSETKQEQNFARKTVINGKAYERREVYQTLYKKYGPMAEKILQNLEKNADFIEVIKLYGSNKELLQAAIEQPEILRKLKSAGNLSKTELASAYSQCTNSSSTELMLQALATTKNAQKSIEITKKGKIFNMNDDALDILTSCKDTTSKQNELEELYG